MSDYHILSGDEAANAYVVIFHVSVPDVANEVGVNYRAAILEYQGEPIVSRVPFISGAELIQLEAGELYEVSRSYASNPLMDLAAKRDELDAMYAQVVIDTQDTLQKRLGYWGYSRDVP